MSLSAEALTPDSDRSGFLVKQGKVRKNWKKRWFILKDDLLYYYKTPREKSPIKTIHLSPSAYVNRAGPDEVPKPHGFVLRTLERVWLFSSESDQDTELWVSAINKNIMAISGESTGAPEAGPRPSVGTARETMKPFGGKAVFESNKGKPMDAPGDTPVASSGIDKGPDMKANGGAAYSPSPAMQSSTPSGPESPVAIQKKGLRPVPKKVDVEPAKRPESVPLPTARATFDFDPEHNDELTLREGDIVVVTEKRDDGWWRGRVGGREGLFPGNYVEEIKGEKKFGVNYY